MQWLSELAPYAHPRELRWDPVLQPVPPRAPTAREQAILGARICSARVPARRQTRVGGRRSCEVSTVGPGAPRRCGPSMPIAPAWSSPYGAVIANSLLPRPGPELCAGALPARERAQVGERDALAEGRADLLELGKVRDVVHLAELGRVETVEVELA